MNPIRSRGRGGGKRGRRPTKETNLDRQTESKGKRENLSITPPSENGISLEGENADSGPRSTEAQASVSTLTSDSGLSLPTASKATSKLCEAVAEPASLPSFLSLSIDFGRASNFPRNVEKRCGGWFDDEELAKHGIKAACQRVVDTIYEDNDHLFAVFMGDAKLSPGDGCCGNYQMHAPWCVRGLSGIAYITPLTLGSRKWKLFVFELHRLRPKIITLSYNGVPEYNEQQMELEVFGKSLFGHHVGDEMITLSGRFSYPKFYVFDPFFNLDELRILFAPVPTPAA